MKKCPYCDEWNIDEVIQCRHCHEWLELEPTPRKKTSPKSSAKKKKKQVQVTWQTKLEKIWQVYKIPIVAGIILVIGLLFSISQKPDVSKEEMQAINAKPPVTEKSAAPAPQTVSALQSTTAADSADDFFIKALSLCPGRKCTDLQKVIEYLNEAIKRRPGWAEAFNNRGNAYGDLGQHQRALDDYNEAIRLKPNYAQAYGNRGGAYDDLGQYQKALEDYNEAIRLNPNFVHAYANRGNAYFTHGNKDLGCRDLQKACELGMCKELEKAKSQGSCY